MTTLPKEVLSGIEKKSEPQVWYHNWLYSVVPSSKGQRWHNNVWEDNPNLYPFLAGYCRNCNKAFSVEIPTDPQGFYQETPLNIPKEGCAPPPR